MMIIGLPRSRTAWLSVFMSQSKTYFHHEAVNGCFSIDEYKDKIKDCGDSTTAFFQLKQCVKDNKIVIIKKNKSELESCIRWLDFTYKSDSKSLITEMDEYLNSVDGLVINQSEVSERLKDIWCHLVDDDWDDKYKEITKFNIQVVDTKINKEAAAAFYETI